MNQQRQNRPKTKKIVVKQTATSYLRMLKANPILKYQLEGKDIPEELKTDIDTDDVFKHLGHISARESLAPPGKQSILTAPKKLVAKDKEASTTKPNNNVVKSRYPNYLKSSKPKLTKPTRPIKKPRRSRSLDNHQVEASSVIDLNTSLSMQDLHAKKVVNAENDADLVFKTPSAYNRRSVLHTPLSSSRRLYKSSSACKRQSVFVNSSVMSSTRLFNHCSTPRLPSYSELQRRLNEWLAKRGKSLSTYSHLKCFGLHGHAKQEQVIDEENKENVEVLGDPSNGSYEDLGIPPKTEAEEDERVAKAALEDLHQLILEGYNRSQCEYWLQLIREKYGKLDSDPQYWECRAAIEQSRSNIGQAIEYYKNAIINGAEVTSVDQSLDQLLEKFSILNINTEHLDHNKTTDRERIKHVEDVRNVFKSSIIQFAVLERKMKTKNSVSEAKELVATPVRRSTRLSRSNYTSTPGVQMCASLNDLSSDLRKSINFQRNDALC